MVSTELIQSRIASLIASRSVREPLVTGRTSAPSSRMLNTLGSLAADVLLAHVDDALQAESGTGRGRGDAVLPGPGLGDHPPLAHPQREQRLAERIVDLVRAGVVQVFALQVDLGTAALLAQPPGMVQRRGAAHVVLQQIVQLGLKTRVAARLFVLGCQLVQRRLSVSGTYRPPKSP